MQCMTVPMVRVPNSGHSVRSRIDPNSPSTTACRWPTTTYFQRVLLRSPANSSVVCGDEFVALYRLYARSAYTPNETAADTLRTRVSGIRIPRVTGQGGVRPEHCLLQPCHDDHLFSSVRKSFVQLVRESSARDSNARVIVTLFLIGCGVKRKPMRNVCYIHHGVEPFLVHLCRRGLCRVGAGAGRCRMTGAGRAAGRDRVVVFPGRGVIARTRAGV